MAGPELPQDPNVDQGHPYQASGGPAAYTVKLIWKHTGALGARIYCWPKFKDKRNLCEENVIGWLPFYEKYFLLSSSILVLKV